MGNHIKNVAVLLKMLFFSCLDLKKTWNARAVEFVHQREGVECEGSKKVSVRGFDADESHDSL